MRPVRSARRPVRPRGRRARSVLRAISRRHGLRCSNARRLRSVVAFGDLLRVRSGRIFGVSTPGERHARRGFVVGWGRSNRLRSRLPRGTARSGRLRDVVRQGLGRPKNGQRGALRPGETDGRPQNVAVRHVGRGSTRRHGARRGRAHHRSRSVLGAKSHHRSLAKGRRRSRDPPRRGRSRGASIGSERMSFARGERP